MVNYRRIEYFLAVVDAGTITAAAADMHVAQPALSRQIKTLERELRLTLFETKGNRLGLTPAGRAFVPAARRLMGETRALNGAADTLRTGQVSELRVAATIASLHGFIAPFIATMTDDDPMLLTQDTSHFDIAESLVRGADFAISPAEPLPGLDIVPLGSIAITAYVHADHEWAREGVSEMSLAQLCRNAVVVPSHNSVSRHILDNALSREGLTFDRVTECDDGQTIIALSAAGRGVGITTERPAYGAYGVRILDPAGGPVLGLPLHVAWLPGHFAHESIKDIAGRIRDFLGNQHIMVGG